MFEIHDQKVKLVLENSGSIPAKENAGYNHQGRTLRELDKAEG